jgi:ACS family glucarate transporter-like MFS transporter
MVSIRKSSSAIMTAPTLQTATSLPAARAGKLRYLILLVLFVASSVSYGDRAALGVAGAAVAAALGLSAIQMGYALSAQSLPYLLMQVPGGILLDRFGSRWIYCGALALLSLATIAQGASGLVPAGIAVAFLFAMRFLNGVFSSPIVLANARITANWFPTAERGLASAIFNTAQYFALVAFAPLSAWAVHALGWPFAFYILGGLGLAMALAFPLLVRSPLRHPWIGAAEFAHIEQGGGLVHIETTPSPPPSSRVFFRRVAFRRQLVGLYLFQYSIGVLSSFFMTWFPIYLVKHGGMTIWQAGIGTAVPALFGLCGGVSGGVISDMILRRGGSLTFARGVPVFIGFSTAMLMVVGNYTIAPLPLIGLMSVAFFGKGVAALGWPMISDIAPKSMIGTTGGVFNMIAATSGVITPIVLGHIVDATKAFDGAIVYVAAHCLLGMAAFALVIRRIERIEL